MVKAKTIEIYLPTGNASKVSETRITSETIKIVYVDKSEVENQKNRLDTSGCYLLVGEDEDGEPSVYIGETEALFSRLLEHKKKKEFWSGAYAIQNTGGTFDRAHLTYLEQLMIEKSKEASRYRAHNSNKGKKTRITESKRNECLLYFDTIKTLFNTLGFNVFEPEVEKEEVTKKEHFYFIGKEWDAKGIYMDEKFVVLEGSKVRIHPTKHKEGSNEVKFRDRLIREGVIKHTRTNELVFIKDYAFSSPSRAADVVSLGSNNGWKVWKTKNGKTLDDLYSRP